MVHNLQSTPTPWGQRLPALMALTLAFAALGGCASVPPPDGAMNQAQAQLQAARDAGAADYAPVDLDYARSRFQQAQQAMASRKYDQAATLADESRADSELAAAKARLGAARAQIQSKTEENSRMRTQMIDNHANDTTPAPTGVQESETVLPAPADPTAPAAGDEGTQPLPNNGNQGGQP